MTFKNVNEKYSLPELLKYGIWFLCQPKQTLLEVANNQGVQMWQETRNFNRHEIFQWTKRVFTEAWLLLDGFLGC